LNQKLKREMVVNVSTKVDQTTLNNANAILDRFQSDHGGYTIDIGARVDTNQLVDVVKAIQSVEYEIDRVNREAPGMAGIFDKSGIKDSIYEFKSMIDNTVAVFSDGSDRVVARGFDEIAQNISSNMSMVAADLGERAENIKSSISAILGEISRMDGVEFDGNLFGSNMTTSELSERIDMVRNLKSALSELNTISPNDGEYFSNNVVMSDVDGLDYYIYNWEENLRMMHRLNIETTGALEERDALINEIAFSSWGDQTQNEAKASVFDGADKLQEYMAQLKDAIAEKESLTSRLSENDGLFSGEQYARLSSDLSRQLEEYRAYYDELQKVSEQFSAKEDAATKKTRKKKSTKETTDSLNEEEAAAKKLGEEYDKHSGKVEKAAKSERKKKEASKELTDALEQEAAAMKKTETPVDSEIDKNKAAESANQTIRKWQGEIAKASAVSTNVANSQEVADYRKQITSVQELVSKLKSGEITLEQFNAQLSDIKSKASEAAVAMDAMAQNEEKNISKAKEAAAVAKEEAKAKKEAAKEAAAAAKEAAAAAKEEAKARKEAAKEAAAAAKEADAAAKKDAAEQAAAARALESANKKIISMRDYSSKISESGSDAASSDYMISYNQQIQNMSELIAKLQEGKISATEFKKSISEIKTEADTAKAGIDGLVRSAKEVSTSDKKRISSLSAIDKKIAEVTHQTESWTKAERGNSSLSYDKLRKAIVEYTNLKNSFYDKKIGQEEFDKEFREINKRVTEYTANIKNAGENTKSLGDRVKGLAEKFGSWLSITRVIMFVVRSIKQMIANVKELDAALTQIEIVTGTSGSALSKFADDAAEVAKQVGKSVTEVIEATETYARLGYTLQESLSLSEVTQKYANVAATTVDEATSSLTAIMKAFGYSAENMEGVVDELVKVGQEYAISAGELGSALQNSASALEAGGNTLEESIALLTAGNAAVQDADKVGNALKTTSMRIRSATSDLEDMGETVDDVVQSTATYRKEIMALSGVDIMADETTYKSTYQILTEIASVWNELTDIQQATLLEDLAGKRNANVVKSIITNLADLQGSYQSASDATGTLSEANDIYMGSMQAKLAQFSASFQEFSQSVIDSDLLKLVVDTGTALMGAATSLNEIGVLLPVIAGTITAIRSKNTIAQESASVMDLVKGLTKERVVTESLASSYVALNGKLRERVVTSVKAAVATGELTQQEAENAIAAFEAAVATDAANTSIKKADITIKSILASNPVGWILTAVSAIFMLVKMVDQAIEKIQQARQEKIREASEISDENENIYELAKSYQEYAKQYKETGKNQDEYLNSKSSLIDSLGIEQSRVDELTEKYKDLNTAMMAAARDKLKEGNIDLEGAVMASEVSAVSSAKDAFGGNIGDGYGKIRYEISFDGSGAKEANDAIEALRNAGYEIKQQGGDYAFIFSDWENDLSSIEDVTAAYEYYRGVLETISSTVGANNAVYDAVYNRYKKLKDALSEYTDTVGDYNRNLVQQKMLDRMIAGESLPQTRQQFTAFRQGILDDMNAAGSGAVGTAEQISDAVNEVLRNDSSFAKFYGNVQDGAEETTTAITGLSAAFSTLSDKLSAMQSAEKEYNSEGHFTAATLAAILEKFPEMDEDVNLYLAGLKSGAQLLRDLKNAYADDAASYRADIVNKLMQSDAFLSGLNKTQTALVKKLAEQYGLDFDNFTTVEDAKLQYQATIIEALANNYSKYTGATLEELINARDRLVGVVNAGKTDKEASGYDFSKESREITALNTAIASLQKFQLDYDKLKEELTKGIKLPDATGDTDSTEKYTATIEKCRIELEKLNRVRREGEDLDWSMENSERLFGKAAEEAYKKRLALYEEEKRAITELNNARGGIIQDNIAALKAYGFEIEYDAKQCRLFVNNLELLNSLSVSNDKRKEIEELIDATEELNDANREEMEAYRELSVTVVDSIRDMVSAASDAVDSIQEVSDTLYSAAKEFKENDGFISVDTYQSILSLGAEYMQYLKAENGQLVINEKTVKKVIAAKTEQLAIENALAYIERVKLAAAGESQESLQQLLFATEELTTSTWGLVYANAAAAKITAGLSDAEYKAMVYNIQAMQSLAKSAAASIEYLGESVSDEMSKMQSGVGDVIQYVMDMIEQQVESEIDAIEELKDEYSELIDKKKESLDATKDEEDYEKDVAKRVKEIAKLQEKINMLSLDGSREALSEKAKLEEELAEKQSELADTQAEHAIEAQKDSLDDMQEAYEKEKDKEIKLLEDSISSKQKLWDKAMDYIEDHYDTLLDELYDWNYEYGSNLKSEITSAWEECAKAAEKYGSVAKAYTALENYTADTGTSISLGGLTSATNPTNKEMITAIVSQMKVNSAKWTNDENGKKLAETNQTLAAQLAQYGIKAVRGDDGVWYIDNIGGKKLYDVYHSGGVVGGGTLKEDETIAKLQNGEVVIRKSAKDAVLSAVDFISVLGKKLSTEGLGIKNALSAVDARTLPEAGDGNNNNIHFGDVYISGTSEETAKQHIEINRKFTNEVLKQLNIKK